MSHVCKTPKMAQQTSRPGLIITYDKPLIKNLCITRQPKPVEQWWHGKHLLKLHERLRRMLVNVELGLTLLYVTTSSASALDCGTVRDAMERHASASQSVLVLRWVKKCKRQTTVERKKCKTVIFSVVFIGIVFYLTIINSLGSDQLCGLCWCLSTVVYPACLWWVHNKSKEKTSCFDVWCECLMPKRELFSIIGVLESVLWFLLLNLSFAWHTLIHF